MESCRRIKSKDIGKVSFFIVRKPEDMKKHGEFALIQGMKTESCLWMIPHTKTMAKEREKDGLFERNFR